MTTLTRYARGALRRTACIIGFKYDIMKNYEYDLWIDVEEFFSNLTKTERAKNKTRSIVLPAKQYKSSPKPKENKNYAKQTNLQSLHYK